jgi:hypothetical protein
MRTSAQVFLLTARDEGVLPVFASPGQPEPCDCAANLAAEAAASPGSSANVRCPAAGAPRPADAGDGVEGVPKSAWERQMLSVYRAIMDPSINPLRNLVVAPARSILPPENPPSS